MANPRAHACLARTASGARATLTTQLRTVKFPRQSLGLFASRQWWCTSQVGKAEATRSEVTMTTTYLSIHYTKTACNLDDRVTGERYRTDNTDEDCSGTTIGDWLVDNYADRLESIRDHAEVIYPLGPLTLGEGGLPFTRNANGLPGLIALGDGDSQINGSAGVHAVLKTLSVRLR